MVLPPALDFSSTCPLCEPTPHETLWQDHDCRVVLLNDVDYPGYCRVECLAHVKEMTDLDKAQRVNIMSVVFATEQAVRQVLQPSKINLASLGNKTPHMHWHVIPRFENDRHFPNSHWGETMRVHVAEPLSAHQKQQLKVDIIKALKTEA